MTGSCPPCISCYTCVDLLGSCSTVVRIDSVSSESWEPPPGG